ncbi:hypothetical protein [Vogesella indigofera]|uniref:hypothetical protein n=1 Tax=Vogesella indigofera TaxID=45465 RepID=UPI0035ADCB96
MSTTTREEWITQITEKTGSTSKEIEALLKRHGIEPRLTHAVPKRLRLLDLKFDGTKTGDYETPEINFCKQGMNVGLHAFVSERNLKGKTSLLKIIRWVLTGTRGLPTDMARWFRTLSLKFQLDNDAYEVRLDDAEKGQGRLVKFARGKEFVVEEFSDMHEFAGAMDRFFLEELGLEALEVIAEKAGGNAVEQRHGWNWLFGAMWIDPDPTTVFGGDDIQHNKPTRMMQMYLGLPWIMTRASLMEAKKRAKIEGDQKAKAARQVSDAAQVRLNELRKVRDELLSTQTTEPPLSELFAKLSENLSKYSATAEKVRRYIIVVNEVETALRKADGAVTTAARELSAFLESQAAGHIFRKLSPVSCPSCEEAYTDDFREARQKEHDCIVCGRAERRESDDMAGVEAQLKEDLAAAKDEARKLRSRLADFIRKKAEAEGDQAHYNAEAQQLEKEIEKVQSRPEGQMGLLKLEAQIEELERMMLNGPASIVSDVDLLDAAIIATQKMYEEEQNGVLKRVSDLTAEFARAFGLSDLRGVRLKGNTHMDVVMLGGKKNFGGCTDGEKTRLKLAATLAMIQVAEQSGIGRHPGVLLVDSVGSHEVVNEDVSQIVTGLAKLSESLPTIQIFIAGIKNDVILQHVPPSSVVKNRSDGYLW